MEDAEAIVDDVAVVAWAEPESAVVGELRDALSALEAAPNRATFTRAGNAADVFVDATLGRKGARHISADFAEHGPTLLGRFSEWAQLFVTAWHEGGHAVAAWALGYPPIHATIVPSTRDGMPILGSVLGGPMLGGFRFDDPLSRAQEGAMFAFAGDVAEEPFVSVECPGARARGRFAAHSFEPSSKSTARGSDFDRYTRLAHRHSESPFCVYDLLAFWRQETVDLLKRYPAEVERVAVALLERRTLDEAALAEILGPAPGGEA